MEMTMTNLYKKSTSIMISAILIGVVFTTINMPSALASDLCGTTILVDTTLTHNQNCTDATGGITIGADGVDLDLAGFTIDCTESVVGTGYLGSCQGLGTVGVDTGGFNGVSVTNGTIDGFEIVVRIVGGSATVANMTITGPTSPGVGFNPRPASEGIFVSGVACIPGVDPITGLPTLNTAVNIQGSTIENHREGIEVHTSTCVNIHNNTIQNNNSDPVACFGIVAHDMDNSNIHHNLITMNGESLVGDAGVDLDSASQGNNIHQNQIIGNFGDGIDFSGDTGGNKVTKNTITGNSFTDVVEGGNAVQDNTYIKNTIGTTAY